MFWKNRHRTPFRERMQMDNRYRVAVVALAGTLCCLVLALIALVAITQPGVTAQAATANEPVVEKALKPTERVYADAYYAATFMALGTYRETPITKEVYGKALDVLGIDFTVYENAGDEIAAVRDALEEHPDIWAQIADELVASGVVPDD